jgi:hypothetical protein
MVHCNQLEGWAWTYSVVWQWANSLLESCLFLQHELCTFFADGFGQLPASIIQNSLHDLLSEATGPLWAFPRYSLVSR